MLNARSARPRFKMVGAQNLQVPQLITHAQLVVRPEACIHGRCRRYTEGSRGGLDSLPSIAGISLAGTM